MPKILLLLLAAVLVSPAEQHTLTSTPKTVHWGYYDSGTPPVLRVKSGDTVEIRSSMIDSPAALERAGLPPAQIEQAHRDIYRKVRRPGRDLGPHILTGPVYVEGAEPWDTLEVRIESVRLAVPYAVTVFFPGLGVLPEDYPYERRKIIALNRERMIARFAPLRPGSMLEIWTIKDLVAGTTLYIPVHVRGALFSIGDAHAAQGNGEVCLSALETVLTGVFRLTVRKDMRLRWPIAETATHYMTMGFDENLDLAIKIALRELIDFLVSRKKLGRDDAYMLASVAADFSITQLVDGKRRVHAMMPKSIFVDR